MNEHAPRAGFDAFRDAVLRDPALQQRLAEPFDPAHFKAMALAHAGALGIALQPDELDVARAYGWVTAGLRGPAPLRTPTWPDAAWLPVALHLDGEIAVDWAHFAGEKPTRPFFHESSMRASTQPFNRMFRQRTPLDALLAGARDRPPPRGLVFHMSRCGSTLVSQMLGAMPDAVVLSEPEPLDTLLQLPLPPGLHADAVRALAIAMTRGHAHGFIKTDAWHTLAMPLLLGQALPEVPWVFLYRDPVEVLVSHERMGGRHVVPGVVPMLDGVEYGLPGPDYAARALARVCEAVLAYGVERGGLLVDYDELPGALFSRILPHFGLAPTPDDVARMQAAARRDAKAPDSTFAADGEAKRREASDAVREAARHLAPVHAELVARRRAQS